MLLRHRYGSSGNAPSEPCISTFFFQTLRPRPSWTTVDIGLALLCSRTNSIVLLSRQWLDSPHRTIPLLPDGDESPVPVSPVSDRATSHRDSWMKTQASRSTAMQEDLAPPPCCPLFHFSRPKNSIAPVRNLPNARGAARSPKLRENGPRCD